MSKNKIIVRPFIFTINRTAPTELFAKILKQKAACNDLLEKKNELIATLEEEVKESDNEYKALIDDYHENIAVISSRMEYQIQALESLVNSERLEVERAYERQRREELDSTAALWNEKLDGIDAESERQMDHRLQLLLDNEEELDRMIREDGEDFVDMKHGLEDSISVLSDQIQFTEAIHQLNEERLDYEIHVLRKREEEIVLVKSEQKRKITSLQDGINKLRGKVSESHKRIAKEEGQLQAEIADMRKQIHKLEAMRKSSSAHFEKQKREIFEMVKEEVYEDLMDMVEKDYVLQRAVRDPKDVQRVQLYLDPLLAASSSKRKVPPSAELKQSSSRTEKRTSVTPAGAAAGPASALLASSVKTDSNMKELLSALVHEANFLVEENLSILVDDIDEDERNLFKLDSILAAIGMEGEEEVLSILRRLAAGGGGSSNSWARGEILKTIRQHVEAQQRKKAAVPTAATTVASKKISSSSAAGAAAAGGGGGGKVWDEGEEEIQEWNAMIASIGQLMNSDRQQMARELEQRAKNRKKVEALQEENQRMEVKIREMTNIYESITGEKLVPEQELLEL